MNIITSTGIFDLIRDDLAKVEIELTRLLTLSRIEVVDKLSSHIQNTSGKRLRPALLLLSAKSFNIPSDVAVKFASVFELIHTATLIHDDVIDHASTRRGSKTLNSLWGNTLTVLFGDLLYLKAMSSAIEGRNWQMMEVLANVTSKVIEGELIQHDYLFDIHLQEDQYFNILERKTALLFAACCKSGAILAETQQTTITDFEKYGLHIGRSFQLIDDLLDYSSTQDTLGKPVFTDLKEGKLTLPIIYMRDINPLLIQPIISDFWSIERSDTNMNELVSKLKILLDEHKALEYTYGIAKKETDKALLIMNKPEYKSEAYDFFRLLPSLLLDRVK